MKTRIPLVAAAVALIAGCATLPTGPAVTVLPGSTKTFDQFRADDDSCRAYAYQMVGGPAAVQNAQNQQAANAVAAAALGAAAGALIGSVSGQAGQGAAIGAGSGLVFGSAAGANYGSYSTVQMQQQYDSSYMQCMYAKGNQVPGRVATRQSAPQQGYYPAPSYPPAGYGAPSSYPPPDNYPPPSYPPPNTPPPSGVGPSTAPSQS